MVRNVRVLDNDILAALVSGRVMFPHRHLFIHKAAKFSEPDRYLKLCDISQVIVVN